MNARRHSRSDFDTAAAVIVLCFICLFGLATFLAATSMADGFGEGASYFSTWGNIASLRRGHARMGLLRGSHSSDGLGACVAGALLAAAVTWVGWWLLLFAFT